MIRIEGLRKVLEGETVLGGVTADIAARSIVAVVGPSGTGKSVLLKHVIGLLEPDAGDVWVGNRSVARASARELEAIRSGMGYAFQDGALLDSLTIRENLRLALPDRDLTDTVAANERFARALETVNLDASVLDRLPRELSGGMRKRVGVARAVVNEPEIILYDEPTTGLDPANAAAICEVIARTRERLGATCVVVTHDLDLVRRIADRVLLLRGGLIRFDGRPSDFLSSNDPEVVAFLGRTSSDPNV